MNKDIGYDPYAHLEDDDDACEQSQTPGGEVSCWDDNDDRSYGIYYPLPDDSTDVKDKNEALQCELKRLDKRLRKIERQKHNSKQTQKDQNDGRIPSSGKTPLQILLYNSTVIVNSGATTVQMIKKWMRDHNV